MGDIKLSYSTTLLLEHEQKVEHQKDLIEGLKTWQRVLAGLQRELLKLKQENLDAEARVRGQIKTACEEIHARKVAIEDIEKDLTSRE